jgi:hypothetical protein
MCRCALPGVIGPPVPDVRQWLRQPCRRFAGAGPRRRSRARRCTKDHGQTRPLRSARTPQLTGGNCQGFGLARDTWAHLGKSSPRACSFVDQKCQASHQSLRQLVPRVTLNGIDNKYRQRRLFLYPPAKAAIGARRDIMVSGTMLYTTSLGTNAARSWLIAWA